MKAEVEEYANQPMRLWEIELDVERMIARLRRVLKGPAAFPFAAKFEYERGVLIKELRIVAYNLGAEWVERS